MTTRTPFQPSSATAFTFQATLDGEQYTVVVTYNLFGQRYYASVYDLSGNLVSSRGLVSSTALIGAALTWADGIASATLTGPHGIAIGSVAQVKVAGTGLAYDGTFDAFATGLDSLEYYLEENPGSSASGTVTQVISLVTQALDGTYFASTLTYRQNLEEFGVSP